MICEMTENSKFIGLFLLVVVFGRFVGFLLARVFLIVSTSKSPLH